MDDQMQASIGADMEVERLLDGFAREAGWSIDILATDLSTRALALAALGVWPIGRERGIPRPLLKRFMLRGVRRRVSV